MCGGKVHKFHDAFFSVRDGNSFASMAVYLKSALHTCGETKYLLCHKVEKASGKLKYYLKFNVLKKTKLALLSQEGASFYVIEILYQHLN